MDIANIHKEVKLAIETNGGPIAHEQAYEILGDNGADSSYVTVYNDEVGTEDDYFVNLKYNAAGMVVGIDIEQDYGQYTDYN